ncbi:hypothetical protein [Campylobacter coli]|uniref:hypothetical protein n=1 Tax=Campylobacter coli TaxID=195 RepID=UPI0012CE03FF|nr:hypothetical protein [Campylobacter coli]ECC0590703.1 hypothetical protein [Campylobacter coli]ECC0667334.1 hypothetical protein [Campylobacter coli]ECH5756133.1 hypothetical protein [Campylobacter coli]EDO6855464.1 hypothetical protein [Campylobacter coli]EEK2290500.1 hypothetical protein [Campylobacter coli]
MNEIGLNIIAGVSVILFAYTCYLFYKQNKSLKESHTIKSKQTTQNETALYQVKNYINIPKINDAIQVDFNKTKKTPNQTQRKKTKIINGKKNNEKSIKRLVKN